MTRPELIEVLSFVPGFTTDMLTGLPSERLVELYSDYFEGQDMNERLQELKVLAEKAWFVFFNERDYAHENALLLDQLERFATLVEAAAVAREREACARTCEDMAEGLVGDDVSGTDGAGYCANAIRARSYK